MSSAKSNLGLQDSVLYSAERLREGEFCCLEYRKNDNALCLMYKIYNRADHSMHENLHYFVAACYNTLCTSICIILLQLIVHNWLFQYIVYTCCR